MSPETSICIWPQMFAVDPAIRLHHSILQKVHTAHFNTSDVLLLGKKKAAGTDCM